MHKHNTVAVELTVQHTLRKTKTKTYKSSAKEKTKLNGAEVGGVKIDLGKIPMHHGVQNKIFRAGFHFQGHRD